jgi:hypothetical protein
MPVPVAPHKVALPLEQFRVEDDGHAMVGRPADDPQNGRLDELPPAGPGKDGPLPPADTLVLAPLEAPPVLPDEAPPVPGGKGNSYSARGPEISVRPDEGPRQGVTA